MKSARRIFTCFAFAAVCGAAAADAGDIPVFHPGMWSFSSTTSMYGNGKPRVRTMTRCADPTEEIRKKWESLAAQSCKFSPLAHADNRYSFSSSCNTQGRVVSMKSVITVEKEDSYRVDTQSHTNTQASREIVIAHRVSDCPIGGSPAER